MLVGRQVLLAETGRAGGHVLSGAGRPRHGLTPGWPWQDPRANTDPECPGEDGGGHGAGRLLQGHRTLDTKPAVPSLLRGGALAAQGHECAFVPGVCVCVYACTARGQKCIGRTRLLLPRSRPTEGAVRQGFVLASQQQIWLFPGTPGWGLRDPVGHQCTGARAPRLRRKG